MTQDKGEQIAGLLAYFNLILGYDNENASVASSLSKPLDSVISNLETLTKSKEDEKAKEKDEKQALVSAPDFQKQDSEMWDDDKVVNNVDGKDKPEEQLLEMREPMDPTLHKLALMLNNFKMKPVIKNDVFAEASQEIVM